MVTRKPNKHGIPQKQYTCPICKKILLMEIEIPLRMVKSDITNIPNFKFIDCPRCRHSISFMNDNTLVIGKPKKWNTFM